MAIKITATLVVGKKELQAVGLDTTTDPGLAVDIADWLASRMPSGLDENQLSVGIERKVKRTNG